MTRGGIWVSQSDHSFSPVIWLASRRNIHVAGPLPAIQIWIAYTALLANQIQALFKCTHVGACAQSRPNREMVHSHQTLSAPFEGTWGLGMRLRIDRQKNREEWADEGREEVRWIGNNIMIIIIIIEGGRGSYVSRGFQMWLGFIPLSKLLECACCRMTSNSITFFLVSCCSYTLTVYH